MLVTLWLFLILGSVYSALTLYDDEETSETRKFVTMFDRFFDCLNVRCTSEGKQKRKPDLRPYYSPSDSRFAVSVYIE